MPLVDLQIELKSNSEVAQTRVKFHVDSNCSIFHLTQVLLAVCHSLILLQGGMCYGWLPQTAKRTG